MSVTRTRAVFEKAMRSFGFPNGDKIAVAVSGGADSSAVCLLAREFIEKFGGEMIALIVDHGLRPASREQALITVERLSRRGIDCRLLTWTGEKPATGVEKAAREARYRLLSDACRVTGAKALLLGHHRQDQAETFLMRRARGSGTVGLAGMSAVRAAVFGRILRPVLGLYPADLREYDREAGLDWVEDETNLSDCFERGRLRQTLTAVEIDDAFNQTLLFGEKRRALEERANAFVGESVEESDFGYLLFDRASFNALERETALYLLGAFLRRVANRAYPPRSESLVGLYENLRERNFAGSTLGGCRLAPTTKNRMIVWREESDLPPPVTVTGVSRFSWDGFSFEFECPLDFPVTVAPLGRRLKIGKVFAKRAFSVLPAIFDNQGLFIVPHLGYKRTKTTCQVVRSSENALRATVPWTRPVM